MLFGVVHLSVVRISFYQAKKTLDVWPCCVHGQSRVKQPCCLTMRNVRLAATEVEVCEIDHAS